MEVFAFDVLRAAFADVVALGIKSFSIALPVIGVEVLDLAAIQLTAKLAATLAPCWACPAPASTIKDRILLRRTCT